MKLFLIVLSASLLSAASYANDSIYGGFNPASRCDNPAGLENPIGVKKSICREMLSGEGIYACIRPSEKSSGQDQKQVEIHSCLKPRDRVVPQGKTQVQVYPQYCENLTHLTEDMDATLIDPLINYPRSNNEYLEDLTIGEYRAACENLDSIGAL